MLSLCSREGRLLVTFGLALVFSILCSIKLMNNNFRCSVCVVGCGIRVQLRPVLIAVIKEAHAIGSSPFTASSLIVVGSLYCTDYGLFLDQ